MSSLTIALLHTVTPRMTNVLTGTERKDVAELPLSMHTMRLPTVLESCAERLVYRLQQLQNLLPAFLMLQVSDRYQVLTSIWRLIGMESRYEKNRDVPALTYMGSDAMIFSLCSYTTTTFLKTSLGNICTFSHILTIRHLTLQAIGYSRLSTYQTFSSVFVCLTSVFSGTISWIIFTAVTHLLTSLLVILSIHYLCLLPYLLLHNIN